MQRKLPSDKEKYPMLTINITGHRPNKLFGYIENSDKKYDALKHAMKVAVKHIIDAHCEKESVTVISGMALGVDQVFVEAMRDARAWYRKQGMNFSILAAVPCEEQPNPWPESSRKAWKKLLGECDGVEVLQKEFTPDCMEKRNKFMVDKAQATIAVWNGTKGGTKNCVDDAMAKGNEIYIIDPKEAIVRQLFYETQEAA